MNLNDERYTILCWLTILLKNRTFEMTTPLAVEVKDYLIKNFSVNYEKYDVIVGYRADDSYFAFAQDFINGTISFRQLSQAMFLEKLGQQFVLKSKKAFNKIKYIESEIVDHAEWYIRKEARDEKVRSEYFNLKNNKRLKKISTLCKY